MDRNTLECTFFCLIVDGARKAVPRMAAALSCKSNTLFLLHPLPLQLRAIPSTSTSSALGIVSHINPTALHQPAATTKNRLLSVADSCRPRSFHPSGWPLFVQVSATPPSASGQLLLPQRGLRADVFMHRFRYVLHAPLFRFPSHMCSSNRPRHGPLLGKNLKPDALSTLRPRAPPTQTI